MKIKGVIEVKIPEEGLEPIMQEIRKIVSTLEEIKLALSKEHNKAGSPYLTAIEFMDAVKIRRSKFDQLVQLNMIKTIKKERKIYVPFSEVDRYFNDPSIR